MNAPNNNGITPLYEAAQQGKKTSYACECNVHWTVEYAFHDEIFIHCNFNQFSHLGRVKVVEALIANGANVSATDTNGYTPLDIAAEKGNLPTISIRTVSSLNNSLFNSVFFSC